MSLDPMMSSGSPVTDLRSRSAVCNVRSESVILRNVCSSMSECDAPLSTKANVVFFPEESSINWWLRGKDGPSSFLGSGWLGVLPVCSLHILC